MKEPENTTHQMADLGADARSELSWKLMLKPEMRIRRAPVPGSHKHY
jgi:hypothetical protein